MKQRLITALICGTIAGAVGFGVAHWMKLEQTFGIVLATAVIGFLLGLVFKLRLT